MIQLQQNAHPLHAPHRNCYCVWVLIATWNDGRRVNGDSMKNVHCHACIDRRCHYWRLHAMNSGGRRRAETVRANRHRRRYCCCIQGYDLWVNCTFSN